MDNLPDTDHEALEFIVTLPSYFKSHCCHLLYMLRLSDFQLFWDTLSHVPWNNVIDYDANVDYVWIHWQDLFLLVADSCIPKVKETV